MKRIDIANNIKAVEMMKVELLQDITNLFADISADADNDSAHNLARDAAEIINITFLLCGRLGISYEDVKSQMKELLKSGIEQERFLEKRFGDFSDLLKKID